MLIKGKLLSPAIALAINVFPVPGGPDNKAPLGTVTPNDKYLSLFLIISTNSSTDRLAFF